MTATKHATRSSASEIQTLVSTWSDIDGLILSIAMPLRPAGPEAEQNEIRRKNALRDAESLLEAHDDQDAADGIREQLAGLQDLDLAGVSPDIQGVLWLVSSSQLATTWTPQELDEEVSLRKHAVLRPLVPLLSGVGAFHLLALSEDTVQLYRGNSRSLHEVEMEEVGKSLADERWMDDFERTLQGHAGSRGGAMIHHGHGGAKEHDETRREQFLMAVARAVHHWRDKHELDLPFGIAAVARTASEFSESYADAPEIDFTLPGSPEGRTTVQLHRAAVEALSAHRNERVLHAEEQYGNAIAVDQAESDACTIVKFATTGRVATLLVSERASLPAMASQADDGSTQWTLCGEPASDATADLVDVAIASVVRHGGKVVSMPTSPSTGSKPDRDTPPLRATLRY